jgi:hypothetical protein
MITIYKYEIPLLLSDYFELELSTDAEILTVQIQNDKPQLWVKTSSNYSTLSTDYSTLSTETRCFKLFGTGQDLTFDAKFIKYIGTFQLENGFVGHLFELKKELKNK